MRTIGLVVIFALLAGVPAAYGGEPGVPDRKLQKAIDKAIQNGAKWLRTMQKRDGSIGIVKHRGVKLYEIGATALAGLALLAAGDKQGDESVDKIMAYCKLRDRKNAGVRSHAPPFVPRG